MEYSMVLDIDSVSQNTFWIAALVQLNRVTVECQRDFETKHS